MKPFALLALCSLQVSAADIPSDCNRACLENVMEP